MDISIYVKSFQFALPIVKQCMVMEEQGSTDVIISKQLLRSSTSIGANAAEAKAGQSRKDFMAKMCLSSKEAREAQLEELLDEVDQIVRILTALINPITQNSKKGPAAKQDQSILKRG